MENQKTGKIYTDLQLLIKELHSEPQMPICLNNKLDDKLVSVKITSIEWERVWIKFNIEIENNKLPAGTQLDYYMVTGFYMANVKMKVSMEDATHGVLSVNYTNPGYQRCIPTANYHLYAVAGDDVVCRLETTIEYAPKVAEASRYYLHNGSSVGFCVNFSLDESDEGLFIKMRVLDSKKSGIFALNDRNNLVQLDDTIPKPSKISLFIGKRKKKLKSRIRKFVRKNIRKYYERRSNKLAKAVSKNPTMKKTVLLMSEQNDVMGANFQAIYDRMIARGVDKEFNVLTSFRAIVGKKEEYGAGSWYQTIKKIASADYIFVDDHCPMFDWLQLNKNKSTLIQIWHAGAGYKGVGYSRWGHEGCPHPFSCHRQYDYCITPSSNIGFFFSEQFGINDAQIVSTGMPRMDQYQDKAYQAVKVQELKELYPIIDGKKVILFAPTYRGKDRKTAMYPYNLIDFQKLYETCGDEYVVLFKMHPWVSAPVPIEAKYADKFIDVGTYPNINDLFYVTDLLISDYSSGVFEYSLMNKPAIFFAFDELQYSYTRGFHRDYRSSTPGKICSTFDEIIDAIKNEDFEFEKMKSYVEYHFEYLDSNASDRVIDYFLFNQIPEKNIRGLREAEEEIRLLTKLDFQSVIPPEILDDEEESEEQTNDDSNKRNKRG